MQSEPSSGIKLTAYSCICWLFHRIYYDARKYKQKKGNNIFVSLRSVISFVLDASQNHKVCIRHKVRTHYISNMCYGKYQLHIPVTILAIIRLHASYQVAVQCMWCIVGGRGLVYNGSGMNTELMDRLQIAHVWY